MNNLNPRQRFLASPYAADHQKWARSESGKAACEAALAEMVMAGADLNKLDGARSLVKLLLQITEPEQTKKPLRSSTLNYDTPKPQPTKPNA